MKKILLLFLVLLLCPFAFTGEAISDDFSFEIESDKSKSASHSGFYSGKQSFAILYEGKPIPYSLFSIFTMPNETVFINIENRMNHEIHVESPGTHHFTSGINEVIWRAPSQPGIYPVTFTHLLTGETIELNMFVKTPRSLKEGEFLNGYRIGKYPHKPLNGNPAYNPPNGFIEVTRENMNTRVSPNFTLGQFLCKQEGGFPKYVLLQEPLLLQLEYTLEEVNKRGYRAPTFTIMSGYRTPWYNARIGNGRYSRHLYGDAADIYIDANPNNGMMDDLNGDGVVDRRDAMILYEIIEELQRDPNNPHVLGGIGVYERRPWRGPFVHVDTRGFRARWYQ